jgi:hypothetical protein
MIIEEAVLCHFDPLFNTLFRTASFISPAAVLSSWQYQWLFPLLKLPSDDIVLFDQIRSLYSKRVFLLKNWLMRLHKFLK